jgi:GTPase SAR1 family protein
MPQKLVIVGKQSAGKSSLLQSLTDIPFPVGDGLCTKFATRIISKRSSPGSKNVVKASIEIGDVNPFGQVENTQRAKDFSFVAESMTAEDFRELIQTVSWRGLLGNFS